jgi:hypothetical protein
VAGTRPTARVPGLIRSGATARRPAPSRPARSVEDGTPDRRLQQGRRARSSLDRRRATGPVPLMPSTRGASVPAEEGPLPRSSMPAGLEGARHASAGGLLAIGRPAARVPPHAAAAVQHADLRAGEPNGRSGWRSLRWEAAGRVRRAPRARSPPHERLRRARAVSGSPASWAMPARVGLNRELPSGRPDGARHADRPPDDPTPAAARRVRAGGGASYATGSPRRQPLAACQHRPRMETAGPDVRPEVEHHPAPTAPASSAAAPRSTRRQAATRARADAAIPAGAGP